MPEQEAVRLWWETVSEIDLLGFHLYRAEAVDGPHARLNATLIPSQSPGSPVGATYEFLDETTVPSITYYCWLEDVDLRGVATRHGPVAARVEPVRLHDIDVPLVLRNAS